MSEVRVPVSPSKDAMHRCGDCKAAGNYAADLESMHTAKRRHSDCIVGCWVYYIILCYIYVILGYIRL